MDNYSKILICLILTVISFACTSFDAVPPQLPNERLSDFEQALTGTWKYKEIRVNNTSYYLADYNSEPGRNRMLTDFGFRAELERRRINYSPEKTYQLRWVDRGNYVFGTEGDPNWQPSFGYWYHIPNTDSVVHNIGLEYAIKYKITILDNVIIRTSNRYMSSDRSSRYERTWDKGDIITFKEIFERVD